MRFHVPVGLPSLANLRLHWRKFAALKKKQKKATTEVLFVAHLIEKQPLPRPPLLVTITRIGPRKLDDDNLASACKYVRDAIADFVGMDDGSNQYTWQYEQRVGRYGVDVKITSRC